MKWERAKRLNLRILQWNADGIGNKGAELEECMIRMNVNVAVIQQSKLGVNRRTLTFAGYVVVRKDRVNGRRSRERMGGGLITVIKKDLVYKELNGWKGKTTEGMRVAIDVSKNERIIITNVYMLPVRRIEGEDERVNRYLREW